MAVRWIGADGMPIVERAKKAAMRTDMNMKAAVVAAAAGFDGGVEELYVSGERRGVVEVDGFPS